MHPTRDFTRLSRRRLLQSALPAALAGAGLVVNGTSSGMVGHPDLDVDLSAVRDDAVVADVV